MQSDIAKVKCNTMSNIIINLSSCQIHRRRQKLQIGNFNVYLSLRRDLHIKNYSATKFELVLKHTLKVENAN